MNPADFIDSATGIVVVTLIFAPVIIAIIALLAIVLSVVNRRHKERMKMIEQGMMPPPPRKQKGSYYYALLIVGAVHLAFGLALCAGKLVKGSNDLTGGFISGFIGLALLACFIIIGAVRKNDPADKTDAYPPAPPPIPPQP